MAACGDSQTPQAEVVEALFSLVTKSLVCTVADSSWSRYRLLDITRAYARIKLGESGEEAEVRQRQARYYMESLNLPAGREGWVETSEQVSNIRAILGWGFATEGMDALVIELSAAAASLWLREGLLVDSGRWTRKALARLDGGANVRSELDARIALASSLMYTHGITAQSHRNWEIIYRRTEFDGRSDLRLAGLAVLWGHQIRLARFGAAQRLLDESDFLEAVKGDATVTAPFHWLDAATAHYRGDHTAARWRAERILDELTEAATGLMHRLFGYDLEVGALRLLSLSHVFLGDVDNALALRARATARASELSCVNPIYWQLVMAYLLDEAEEVDRLTTSLESEEPNALRPAVGTGIAFQGLSLMRRGEIARGRQTVLRGSEHLPGEADYYSHHAFIHAELALQLARHGSPMASEFFFEEPDDETWCTPEVIRIKGEIAELSGDSAEAEARYLDALAMARRHGALIWRPPGGDVAGCALARPRPGRRSASDPCARPRAVRLGPEVARPAARDRVPRGLSPRPHRRVGAPDSCFGSRQRS